MKVTYEFSICEGIVLITFILCVVSKKLTLNGALSALLVGTLISFAGWDYLVILYAFFISSTIATDIHKHIKTTLYGNVYAKEKKRNAIQVLCKGLFPSCISVIIAYCKPMLSNKCVNLLSGIYIGYFVSANADTWASELGIASTKEPVLITTFKTVPKGTNGGVTLFGTCMSICGGCFITIVEIICNVIKGTNDVTMHMISIKIIVGCVIGFVGSLLDSIIGAVFQMTIYNTKTKQIVEQQEYMSMSKTERNIFYVNGKDVLSNSQVNLITCIISSVICGVLCYLIL